jgi:uncharacterized hydrophobic protein (TIGR00271 family)
VTVLAVVRAPEDVDVVVPWAARVARGQGGGLVVLAVEAGPTAHEEVAAADASPHPALGRVAAALARDPLGAEAPVEVRLRRASDEPPGRAVVVEARALEADLVVVGLGPDRAGPLPRAVAQELPCDVLLLSDGGRAAPDPVVRSVLVATAGGPHARVALRLARTLARGSRGTVTALLVAPQGAGVEEAEQRERAARRLERALAEAGLPPAEVEARVVVSDRPAEVIASAAGPHDLVLVGASARGPLERVLGGSVPDQLLRTHQAVGVVRGAVDPPALRRLVVRLLPQLDRDERRELAQRIDAGSRWSFDFMALLALAAGIAAVGHIQSSPAVVIGANVVAPLMTPVLGVGLGIVQGNPVLARSAAGTIARGTLLSFVVALVIGALDRGGGITPELLARGAPTLADLLVAFLSGVAGAYSLSRRDLSGALPGVAIASALIPPIAAAGVATAIGAFTIARGAALLFATNLVAIALAAAIVFRLTGVQGERGPGRAHPWVRSTVLLLLLLAGALLIPLSAAVATRLAPARAVPEDAVSTDLTRRIRTRVEAEPGGALITVAPTPGGVVVVVVARDEQGAPPRLEAAIKPLLGERTVRVVCLPQR